MFLTALVCFFLCLYNCLQNYWNSYGQILLKLSGNVDSGTRNTRFIICDPDYHLVLGIV